MEEVLRSFRLQSEQSRPQYYHIKLNAFAAEMSSFDQTPPLSQTPPHPHTSLLLLLLLVCETESISLTV